MQIHQRYAMKFLGVGVVVIIGIGGIFGVLAANATGTLPILFGLIGGIVLFPILTVLLFKYVGQMVTEKRQKRTEN